MLPILVSLTFGLSLQVAPPPGLGASRALLDAIADAETVEELRDLSARVERHLELHPDSGSSGMVIMALVRAWDGLGENDESLVWLQRLADDYPETHGGVAYAGMAELQLASGNEDAAIESYLRALDVAAVDTRRDIMDASNTQNLASQGLGRIYEGRGDWTLALEVYEAWQPSSFCGNAVAELSDERERRIARCHFELGHVDQAFDILRDHLETYSPNGLRTRSALLYAQLASRLGRLDQAGEYIDSLPSPASERFGVAIRTTAAIQTGSVRTIYDVVHSLASDPILERPFARSPEVQAAGSALGQLGEPALSFLEPLILSGDMVAVTLAGYSGRVELIPVLEERLAIDPSGGFEVESALLQLRHALRRTNGP